MERFILQKSEKQKDGYVCTDTVNGLVCQFTSHEFNDTQKFTFLEDVEQPIPNVRLACRKSLRHNLLSL